MPSISPTIFREYDVRGLVDQDLTEEAVNAIARGLGTLVREKGGKKVVVGRDCRLSGPRFAKALIAGLASTGCDVVDLGVVPTPLTYFAANTIPGVDGLCMITGSHNPPEYNGLKLGLGQTTFYGEQIQQLRRLVESGRFAEGEGTVREARRGPRVPRVRREEHLAREAEAEGRGGRGERHRGRGREPALPCARRGGRPALRARWTAGSRTTTPTPRSRRTSST